MGEREDGRGFTMFQILASSSVCQFINEILSPALINAPQVNADIRIFFNVLLGAHL